MCRRGRGARRELTARRDAAIVAGLAFAFAPYRMGQLSHLQMLAYYWAPLALLGLHRWLRTGRTGWLAVLATAWLLQALTNGYAMFHFSVLLGLWTLWFVRPLRSARRWRLPGRRPPHPLVPVMLMYRRVHEQLHLVRDINEIKRFERGYRRLPGARRASCGCGEIGCAPPLPRRRCSRARPSWSWD